MAGAGVVDCDIGRAFEAGVQHRGVLGPEGFELGGQRRTTWRFEIANPMPVSSARIFSQVVWP
jgi:hypothetical protein